MSLGSSKECLLAYAFHLDEAFRGVATETKTTQLVADVHQFPGHIACDSASNSEIVVPIVKEGAVIGVLDIDSPEKNRFDEVDQRYLEKFVETLLKHM